MKLNTSPPLRARKVSVKYGDFYGVRNVDVDLDPGEILGIIGPNGAGKTSLIECIEGLRKGSSGEIRLFGLDPIKHRGKLTARIGVQLQTTSYPSRTRVSEICELFAGFYESPHSFTDLLAQFELDARRTEYVDKLSGGEQQKLSLVLALIGRPEILFLDELTTGLDPVARRATWEILRTLSEAGTAIVLTSHHMDEVEMLCDRVMLLVDGAVRESGPVKHFIDQCSDWNHYVLDANIADRLDLDALQRLNHVTSAERQGRRLVLRGPYPAGYDAIAAAVRDRGGDPSQIRHKSPSMEDAFIYLTGLAPEEGSNAP